MVSSAREAERVARKGAASLKEKWERWRKQVQDAPLIPASVNAVWAHSKVLEDVDTAYQRCVSEAELVERAVSRALERLDRDGVNVRQKQSPIIALIGAEDGRTK